MLNLLPWIICTFRGLGWLAYPKKIGIEKQNLDQDPFETCFLESVNKKSTSEEDEADSKSLDDILEDTTWKAVTGPLPKIENDYKILSPISVNQDENSRELDQSFGDVVDGEDYVKNALLMRRESERTFGAAIMYDNIQYIGSTDDKEISPKEQLQQFVVEDTIQEASEIFYKTVSPNDFIIERENQYLSAQGDDYETILRKDSWDSLNVQCNTKDCPVSSTSSAPSEQSVRMLNSLDEDKTPVPEKPAKGTTELAQKETTNEICSIGSHKETSTKRNTLRSHNMDHSANYKESPKAVYNEFNDVMHRRKLHTDTMHQISDTLGHFGNREDKIFGSPSMKRSTQLWQKVRQAVKSKKKLSLAMHCEDSPLN